MQPNTRHWYLRRLGPNNFQPFLPLTSDLVTIGRSNRATFHIKSKYLSRKPFALRFDGDHWTLIANREADITLYVNHYKVFKGEECMLTTGDKIGFGVPVNFANEESSAVYEFCENLLEEENNSSERSHWSCLDSVISLKSEEWKKRTKVLPRMCIDICSSDDEEEKRKNDQKQQNETRVQPTTPQEIKFESSNSMPVDNYESIPAVAESQRRSNGMESSEHNIVTEPHSGCQSYPDQNTLVANASSLKDVSVSSNMPVIVGVCHVNNSDFKEEQNADIIQLHAVDQESSKHDTIKNKNQSSLSGESSENLADVCNEELVLNKVESASIVSTKCLPVQQAETVVECDSDIFKELDHMFNRNDPPPFSEVRDNVKGYKDCTSKTQVQKQSCIPRANKSQKLSNLKSSNLNIKSCQNHASDKVETDRNLKASVKINNNVGESKECEKKSQPKSPSKDLESGSRSPEEFISTEKQNSQYNFDRLKHRPGKLFPFPMKSTLMTNPLPVTIGRRRKSDSSGVIADPAPVTVHKPTSQSGSKTTTHATAKLIVPLQGGKRQKSSKDSLKRKVKHKMGYRIPIPGGGSDVRVNPTSPSKLQNSSNPSRLIVDSTLILRKVSGKRSSSAIQEAVNTPKKKRIT